MITVPPSFAESTIAREGARGEAWIASLPGLVRELSEHWHLSVTGPPMHGYVALVVPVVRGRTPLALKVSWIDQSSEQEALALRCWAGRGAVELLDAREDVGAMLLERLDPGRTLEHVEIGEAVDVAADLLRRLTVPAPPQMRTVAREVAEVRPNLLPQWEAAGRPFSRRIVDAALDPTADPAAPGRPMIVNQDLHFGNVLRGTREPWLVIDPKPLAGAPEFGVAQLLWNRFDELGDRAGFARRFDRIVERAALDAVQARRWTIVRLVESWLWSLEQGFSDDARRCGALLDWLSPSGTS